MYKRQGQISFSVKDTEPGQEYVASTKGFLKEAQKIELNQEIPVAIMIYDNGTEMETCTVQDYFTPEKFKNMDLVQAVTCLLYTSVPVRRQMASITVISIK